jgi:Trk K+ transport system NAD-binding subunit
LPAAEPPAGQFVVCGLGQVGYRVVNLLCRLGERVTVIALPPRDDWLQDVQARGVRVLIGDARSRERLLQAGLLDARALIAATDQDPVNVEIVLDAQALRPDLALVARLFDQALAQQLESALAIRRAVGMSALAGPVFAGAGLGEQLLGSFTLDRELCVVDAWPLAAEAVEAYPTVGLLAERAGLGVLAHRRGDGPRTLGPPADTPLEPTDEVIVVGNVVAYDRLIGHATPGAAPPPARGPLGLLRRAVRPRLAVDYLRQAWEHSSAGLRAVFILLNLLTLLSVFVFHFGMDLDWHDALYFVVTTVTTVGYGDISPRDAPLPLKLYACLLMILGSATIATLYSILTDFIVTARFAQLLGRGRVPQEGHVVVVGVGNVGYRAVDALRQARIPVVAVDRDAAAPLAEPLRAQMPVIVGDARLTPTLVQAGVPRARAVVTVTGDEATNLSVCLATRQLNPHVRTVVRLFDGDFARKVQAPLGIAAALSASAIAAPTFVAAALYPDVRAALVLDDCLLAMLHHTVGVEWAGRTPAEVRAADALLVLLRRAARDHAYGPADAHTPLAAGDQVLAVAVRPLAS